MPVDAPMKPLFGKFYFASPAPRFGFLKPGLYYGTRRVLPLPSFAQPLALVEFPEQTIVYAKDQPEYMPLPAYQYIGDPQGTIVCCWRLAWHARLRLLVTGRIWHSVLTFRQPLQPQLLLLTKPVMPPHKAPAP